VTSPRERQVAAPPLRPTSSKAKIARRLKIGEASVYRILAARKGTGEAAA